MRLLGQGCIWDQEIEESSQQIARPPLNADTLERQPTDKVVPAPVCCSNNEVRLVAPGSGYLPRQQSLPGAQRAYEKDVLPESSRLLMNFTKSGST